MAEACQEQEEWQAYLYGSLAILIISILSLTGAVIIPCIKHKSHHRWMQFFIAIAVATLAGDALLHLIPEVLGAHGHHSAVCNKVSLNSTSSLGITSAPHDDHDHEGMFHKTCTYRISRNVYRSKVFYAYEPKDHEPDDHEATDHPPDEHADHDHEEHEEHDEHGTTDHPPDEHADHDHEEHEEHDEHGTTDHPPDEHADHDHEEHEEHDEHGTTDHPPDDHDHEEHDHEEHDDHDHEEHDDHDDHDHEDHDEHDDHDDHDHEAHGEDGHSKSPLIKMSLVAASIFAFYLFETIAEGVMKNKAQPPSLLTRVKQNPKKNSVWSTSDADNNFLASETHSQAVPVQRPVFFGLTSVALMILVGDAVHNFADGMAVGVSFSQSNTAGLSTSIAVACHELPHEIGLAVGKDDGARPWIFAVVAGMFLYVALVDMMHHLMAYKSKDKWYFKLFLQSFGMLLGFTVIFLLGWYEEHIKI